jgi:hypothetical protein
VQRQFENTFLNLNYAGFRNSLSFSIEDFYLDIWRLLKPAQANPEPNTPPVGIWFDLKRNKPWSIQWQGIPRSRGRIGTHLACIGSDNAFLHPFLVPQAWRLGRTVDMHGV